MYEWLALNAAATLGVSALVGFASRRMRLVTTGGLAAALAVAAAVSLSGWQSYVLLLLFFTSSSLLTRVKYGEKARKGTAEREGGRKWCQVLGTGLVPAACSTLMLPLMLHSNPHAPRELGPLFAAMAASIATSNADTWAVELGSLSRTAPRLITKPWVRVPAGVSGGVTPLGELSSVAGSLAIAAATAGLHHLSRAYGLVPWCAVGVDERTLFLVVAVSGWAGEVLDSVLGATLQAKYHCPRCGVLTDRPVHRCGARARLVSGHPRFTNEIINLISTSAAAALAALMAAVAE